MLRTTPPGRWPRARGARPLTVLVCALATLALPAVADAATRLPDQGVYDACDPATSRDRCESRLRRLSAAGFKVVQKMGVVQTTDLPTLILYGNTAQALGLKVIWQLRPDMPDLSVVATVTALRLHPSTWGYYLVDEPTPQDRAEVAAFAARVKGLDPTHPRLVMGCGNCYGGEGSVSFLADVDVTLGSDVYPVHDQAPNQPIVTRRVAAVAKGLQQVADRAGRKTVVALQAWRWGDSHYDSLATGLGAASRFPTRQEIEDQRNAAIANARPDLILWFRLEQVIGWEPGQGLWFWSEPSDPGQRWANLVGGAFAPLPQEANRVPVARFTLRALPARRGARAAAGGASLRVRLDGGPSYDPDGRIVRYAWYAAGRRRAVCTRRSCSLKLGRASSRRVKLVVTDDRGARASVVRGLPARGR